MSTTAQKWGNSIGVRIPQVIAKQFNVESGSRIEIRAGKDCIILKPVNNQPTLEELLAKCTPENRHDEIDFGRMGRELLQMTQIVDRGDLVYLDFNPQAGHEQAGRRPAIVLSPKEFNEITKFVSVCPITQTERGWGFEVVLPDDLVFGGVILTDQLKNLDWSTRNIQVKGQAPDDVVKECIEKIYTYLDI